MAKKRGKAEGVNDGGEQIAGVPLRRVQEFLCRKVQYSEREGSNERWFDRFGVWSTFTEDKADVERLACELMARGWIKKVASRAATQRYKLTEAGCRYAAECRHLFKWPAAQSRIRPAPRSYGIGREWFDCLKHLHQELSRLKLNPERDISRVRYSFLGDLEGGFDEEALAAMHDWWNYNYDVIAARGNYPARPRIDLTVFLTSKHNLIVEWCPSGMESGRITPKCDWVRWRAERHRRVNWDSRPTNELLFIHGVGHDAEQFTGGYVYDPKFDDPDRAMIGSILLQTAAAMVQELKYRLEHSFKVRMVTDIFMEWEEIDAEHWPSGKAEVLRSWTIENVDERNKKLELGEIEQNKKLELQEIEKFPDEYGCPLEVFVKALIEPDAKKATGPTPSRHMKHDRLSRQLKKAGYSKTTPSVVQHYQALLQRHRPELFPPAPAAPTPTVVPADEKVVPFRKPDGQRRPDDGGPPAA
jgi:hypothetical protein